MGIDPDVQERLAPLEERVEKLEQGAPDAEAAASLKFQAALFPALQKSNDRAALWNRLTAVVLEYAE